ncbi:unnamed protein product [Mytilus coruscus]|uniref:C1q domain-containing protein n=1 Tax=Mytilus coruscus TaxID=42192 RepID=A0A6J8AX22_MYTCO|nr:unnamed protein product [Mytilus coruscus]
MHFEAEAEGSCSTVEKKIFDNLWNTLVALKSGSSNQGASNGKNRPAFTAVLSPNPLTLSGKSAIAKFDTVILNRGGGYDSKTGKFTVPKSGIYQFSFTVFSTNGNTLHMAIVVNGKPIIYVYGAKIHGATGTASPVLELKKRRRRLFEAQ